MLNRIALLLIFGIISLTLISCSDSPSSIGADLLSADVINVEELNSFKDSLNQTSNTILKVVPLGTSNKLLLGKTDNVQSSILVRFNLVFVDSIITAIKNNDLSIVSASVKLAKNYVYGDSLTTLNYSVHKVNTTWLPGSFTGDSLASLSYESEDVASNKVSADSLFFNLKNELVQQWFKGAVDTSVSIDNGIYIQPAADAQKIVGYQALSGTVAEYPTLSVIVKKNDGSYTDTLSFYPISDLSAVTGSIPNVPQGDEVIQGSVTIKTKLLFDVSKLKKGTIVNDAELTLTLDSTLTKVGSSYTNSVVVSKITDPDSLKIDETNRLVLNRDGNTFTGSITPFVQKWISGQNNYGLLVESSDNLTGVEKFVIKGSSAVNPADRPLLKIIYTNKK